MTEFIRYSTNHTRPWMDLVADFGISEERAKELFDRYEPLKTPEERHCALREMVKSVKAEMARR